MLFIGWRCECKIGNMARDACYEVIREKFSKVKSVCVRTFKRSKGKRKNNNKNNNNNNVASEEISKEENWLREAVRKEVE